MGLGSDIINIVKKQANGKTIFLDCEAVYPGCSNRAERVKRQCFYEKNGFRVVGSMHKWREENFQTMVFGGQITDQQIDEFWQEFGHLWDEPDIVQ